MHAELIIPIDSLRGKLDDGGYYFRTYRGKQIVQRTPVLGPTHLPAKPPENVSHKPTENDIVVRLLLVVTATRTINFINH